MNVKAIILFVVAVNFMIGVTSSMGFDAQIPTSDVETQDWGVANYTVTGDGVEEDIGEDFSYGAFFGKGLNIFQIIDRYAFGIPFLIQHTFYGVPGVTAIAVALRVLFSVAYGWLAMEFFRGVQLD